MQVWDLLTVPGVSPPGGQAPGWKSGAWILFPLICGFHPSLKLSFSAQVACGKNLCLDRWFSVLEHIGIRQTWASTSRKADFMGLGIRVLNSSSDNSIDQGRHKRTCLNYFRSANKMLVT